MNSNPKVSIIVPVYKVEKYLDKCVNSIVNQTYKNLEIILVDDGSPDKSGDMCDKWAQNDERVRVLHKENGGVSSARNAALDIMQGDYVSFVDSDDWIEQDMIELLVKNAVESGADISRCGYFFVDEKTGEKKEADELTEPVLLSNSEMLKKTVVGSEGGYVWGKVFKAELFKDIRFDTNLHYSEDLLVNYRVNKMAESMIFATDSKYYYLLRDKDSQEKAMNEHSFDLMSVMDEILEGEKDNPEVYACCIKGYTDAAFTVLSGVITNQKCVDKYDELRNGILSFKKRILFGGHHSTKDKVKTVLLFISPKLYNAMIRKIRNV